MNIYRGTIRFEYFDRVIEFDYSMENLLGNVYVSFEDKKGKHHTFFSTEAGWRYRYGEQPNWRADFMELLFEAFDAERERHGI